MSNQMNNPPSLFKSVLKYLIIFMLMSLVVIFVRTDYFDYLLKNSANSFHNVAINKGFKIKSITVKGRKYTPRNDILRSIDADRGQSIFRVDVAQVKQNLNKIGWIKTATVERRFPDTIFITIKERTPSVIWQLNRKLKLVDRQGTIITNKNIRRFSHLKVLVGKSANKNIDGFFKLISSSKLLEQITTAGVFISERRWNVMLLGKIEVKLPASGAVDAWQLLANYAKEKNLFARNIESIDLRVPNKILLKLNQDKKK